MRNDIYKQKGFKNRSEYLYSLAEEYDCGEDTVFALASVLGRDEDFDGLISSIEDHCESSCFSDEEDLEEIEMF